MHRGFAFVCALAFAIAGFAGASVQAQNQPCRGTGFNVGGEGSTFGEATIVVVPGLRCELRITGETPTSHRLRTPPRQGTAEMTAYGIAYTAAPNASGRDFFEFTSPQGMTMLVVAVRVVIAPVASATPVPPAARPQPVNPPAQRAAIPPPQPVACRQTGWSVRAPAPPEATQRLTVSPGLPCASSFNESTRRNMRVLTAPTRGTVTLSAQGYIYTARPGTSGDDAFQLTWLSGTGSTARQVVLNVRVVIGTASAGSTSAAR